MSKTLAAIINHNAREYTDQLYSSLDPHRRDNYDIMVLDNGSTRPGKFPDSPLTNLRRILIMAGHSI